MNKLLIFIVTTFVMLLSNNSTAQEDTSAYHTELNPVKIVRSNSAYAYELKRVQKLYPYALYAAEILHELDDELAAMDKKRQIKKTSKETQSKLFDEFNYMIKDLYRSEGKLLMKLIHRETGMTVDEIIRRYRGKLQATVYTGMAKMFEQDLTVRYDPSGKDKLTEKVIQDIQNEAVYFDPTYKKVTKEEYKEGMKEYRTSKKEIRQEKRERKKDERKEKRQASKK